MKFTDINIHELDLYLADHDIMKQNHDTLLEYFPKTMARLLKNNIATEELLPLIQQEYPGILSKTPCLAWDENIIEMKRSVAQRVFESIEFPEDISIEATGTWDTSEEHDFVMTAYALSKSDNKNMDSFKFSVHVNFQGLLSVSDACAYDVRTGNEIADISQDMLDEINCFELLSKNLNNLEETISNNPCEISVPK